MKYTSDLFDDVIIQEYGEELKNYLENTDLSFLATSDRVLNLIEENPQLPDFSKTVLKRACFRVLQSIYTTHMPPFLLESNLKLLEYRALTEEHLSYKPQAFLHFLPEEQRILLNHRDLTASDPSFDDRPFTNSEKSDWLYYELFHEVKHLASLPLQEDSFYYALCEFLNEVLTEIIDYPIAYTQCFFGYVDLCGRIFPSYTLLNDQEKMNVKDVFYGGRRELVEEKPYLKTWLSSIQTPTHPFQSFRQILAEEKFQNYYDITLLERIPDPFTYYYDSHYYQKSYLIINFLNEAFDCTGYHLAERAPRIRSVSFSMASKSVLSKRENNNLEKKYHPLSLQQIIKKEKKASSFVDFSKKVPVFSKWAKKWKSHLSNRQNDFNNYYYALEQQAYQKRIFPYVQAIYQIKDQFQKTHTYDSNHHIKEKKF